MQLWIQEQRQAESWWTKRKRTDEGGVQNAAMPSRLAACKAVARTCSTLAPVIVRWPILRPLLAVALPYRCKCVPGKASTWAHGGTPSAGQMSPSNVRRAARERSARPAAERIAREQLDPHRCKADDFDFAPDSRNRVRVQLAGRGNIDFHSERDDSRGGSRGSRTGDFLRR